MTTEQSKAVLIMGGSGQAGSGTAALLRAWHPTLPLTIAGRNLERAQRVADKLGVATATTIDLRRSDLGLPADRDYAAIVATVWDKHLNGLRYAQDRRLPYLSISSGLVEIAPEVVAAGQRQAAAPILLASHYFAGLVVLTVLHSATKFGRIDSVRISGVLDELDAGGPAALADLQRLEAAPAAGLVRRDGVFTWIAGADAQASVLSVDGVAVRGQSIAFLDVPSIALVTGAPNVRLDLAIGESASRRRGEAPSTEVRIDIEGEDHTGAPLRTSRYVVHPEGQQPLTSLGVALGVERLLGLRGEPVAPGMHTPEALLDPADVVERMTEIGTIFIDG